MITFGVRSSRLHVRARTLPLTVVGVVAVAVVGWWASDWLVHRAWSTGADARIPVVVGAPLLAAVFVSVGLGAWDEELEGSTARRWRWIRLTHIAAATLMVGIGLGLIGLWEAREYGSFELVRNVLGFMGLIGVGAALLGARLAWVPPFAYAAVVYFAAPKPVEPGAAWWTWPLQPWETTAATWAATVLFAVGTGVYVLKGARPSRDA